MDEKTHGSPSFINIAVLLLFAVVIAVASAATTYVLLNTRSNQEYQSNQSTIIPSPVATYPTTAPLAGTTQTVSDETANWKVYRNTKVGFTIKYPERYTAPVLPSGVGETIYADGTEDNVTIIFSGIDPDDNHFMLIVSPFNGNVEEFVENQKKTVYSSTQKPYVQQGSSLIVDGKKVLWYFTQSNAIQVYFTGKNHSFIFRTERSSDKEIKQILSTFKFLK
ncbi:MAG TPA: hypothetical protein VJB63_00165 [Patescibacteria group bacterium]|nr:hypothetical protein [Patescibacteria group bacterium]